MSIRHVMPPVRILVATLTCLAGPALGQSIESRDYQDGARGTVTLPQGERSFADVVVSYTQGTGEIEESARDPQATLHAPDYSGDVDDGSFLSLGCDGSVVLQFTDNDRPVEIGRAHV